MSSVNVLFVCLGNICRSPTAEGVFRDMADRQGLSAAISTDSAGTSAWHIGEPPDSRSAREALERGYDISDLRGRQVHPSDYRKFDYILAMDEANLADLQRMAPAEFSGHLGLFLDFADGASHREVPDPYHGGAAGFTLVLDLVESASLGLLEHIRGQHQLG